MLSSRYNPSCIKGTLKPTLPNPPEALLCLPNFKSFFSLFTPSSPSYILSNITVLNTLSTYSIVSNPFTLIPSTPNYHIRRAIAYFNR